MILSEEETSHFDLQHLSDADAVALRGVLSAAAAGATSRQMIAERIVLELFDSLRIAANDEPACVLVRCFQTVTYARMPMPYQDAAEGLLESLPAQLKAFNAHSEMLEAQPALEQMRCLALLATHGLKSVWNDVQTSVGHQAIPLPSVEVVRKAPMIAKLFEQLGMPIERAVVPPDSLDFQVQAMSGDFSVFYIADAVGSPFIPAQDSFVAAHGVRSVLGMGGVLPDGELVAVVMFARVPISQAVAKRFGTLAAEVRSLLLPFAPAQTFRRADF